MATRQLLSDRAKARLRRARILVQNDPAFFGLAPGWKLNDAGGVYEAIQAMVDGLEPAKRDQLRGLVDWVEEYDRGDAEMGTPAQKRVRPEPAAAGSAPSPPLEAAPRDRPSGG